MPVADRADELALLALVMLAGRYVYETALTRLYPERLDLISPDALPDRATPIEYANIALGAVIFVFVAWPFVGGLWQLWVGVAMLVIPQLLGPLSNSFRNLPRLAQVLPTGLPLVLSMLVIGKTVQQILDHVIDDPEQYIGMTFVILAIPSFTIAVAGLYGRDGPSVEVDWPGRIVSVLVTVLWAAALLGRFDANLWLLALLTVPAVLWWLNAWAKVPIPPDPTA